MVRLFNGINNKILDWDMISPSFHIFALGINPKNTFFNIANQLELFKNKINEKISFSFIVLFYCRFCSARCAVYTIHV